MVAIIDRRTPLTEKGDRTSLEFQVLWNSLRQELSSLGVAAASRAVAFRTVAASVTALATDFLILADATAGALTVTLPPAASSRGAMIVTKKTDVSANAVTVAGDGSDTIDGAASVSLASQYDAVTVACDGSGWWIV